MHCRGNRLMIRALVARALSFSAVTALMFNQTMMPALAGDYRVNAAPISADGQMNARPLSLGIGKSIVVDLPRDIKDVLVADPKIANAVIRSAQRAYIIGAAVGQTNIVFFDSAGQQIAAYDIAVKRDLNGARAALKQMLPNADIQIDGLGDGVVLTGTASSPVEAQQAGDLAARLAGGIDKVVNSIVVRGRDQVMLKVTVAEMARTIIKQLGIDLSGSLNYGTSVVNFNNTNPFTAYGRSLVAGNNISGGFGSAAGAGVPSVQATIRAMEGAGDRGIGQDQMGLKRAEVAQGRRRDGLHAEQAESSVDERHALHPSEREQRRAQQMDGKIPPPGRGSEPRVLRKQPDGPREQGGQQPRRRRRGDRAPQRHRRHKAGDAGIQAERLEAAQQQRRGEHHRG